MKEYAKGFYKSAAWKRARQQVITRSNGLCERCKARGIYKPGYIVHHKEYITPGNISNPNITLNLDNLEYVCEDMRSFGLETLYLITDHIGFYERYGWKFLCMAQGDGEVDLSRMYVYDLK